MLFAWFLRQAFVRSMSCFLRTCLFFQVVIKRFLPTDSWVVCQYRLDSLSGGVHSLALSNPWFLPSPAYQDLEKVTAKLERDQAILLKTQARCRQEYKPMWSEALYEMKLFGESEARQKTLFRSCLNRVSAQVVCADGAEKEVKDVVSAMVYDCELNLKLELSDDNDDTSMTSFSSDSDSEFEFSLLDSCSTLNTYLENDFL